MNEKNPLIFIDHILESISDINLFIKDINKERFCKNKEKINAVVRSLEIIGEAAKNLQTSFRDNYQNVPWKKIIGTRDIIIHNYFGVDLDLIWNILKNDLPILEKQILNIKNKIK